MPRFRRPAARSDTPGPLSELPAAASGLRQPRPLRAARPSPLLPVAPTASPRAPDAPARAPKRRPRGINQPGRAGAVLAAAAALAAVAALPAAAANYRCEPTPADGGGPFGRGQPPLRGKIG